MYFCFLMYHTNQESENFEGVGSSPSHKIKIVVVCHYLELKVSGLCFAIFLFYFYSCCSGDLIEQMLAMLSWLWAFFRVLLLCLGRDNDILWCVLVFMCLTHERLYLHHVIKPYTSTHNIFLLFLYFWYCEGNYKLYDWD